MIREINARITKMIIIHFTIVHAILPINPRITNITAITMNNITRVESQSIVYFLSRVCSLPSVL
jgi:hypothetical protein